MDKRITEFILLSYLLSWLAWLPGMLAVKRLISSDTATVFHYCAPLGLALAALYAAFREGGYPGLKKFLSRAFAVPGINVLIIFLLLLVPAGAGFGMLFLHVTGTDLPEGFYYLEFPFLHNPAVVWFFWIFTYGIGEETGWRGYLLPRLLEKFPPQKAWMIVTAVWMCWHLPLFFYYADYQQFLGPQLMGWIIGISAGSVILFRLSAVAKWSILPAAVWHGSYNFFTGSSGSSEYLAMGLTLVVISAAAVLLIRMKSWKMEIPKL